MQCVSKGPATISFSLSLFYLWQRERMNMKLEPPNKKGAHPSTGTIQWAPNAPTISLNQHDMDASGTGAL